MFTNATSAVHASIVQQTLLLDHATHMIFMPAGPGVGISYSQLNYSLKSQRFSPLTTGEATEGVGDYVTVCGFPLIPGSGRYVG